MADMSFSVYFLDCAASDLPPGSLLAFHHKAAVKAVHSHQLVMRALLDDLAVIDHEDSVSILHSFQPVSNHDDRLIILNFAKKLH